MFIRTGETLSQEMRVELKKIAEMKESAFVAVNQ